MRHCGLFLVLAALAAASGCRTPVKPATVPVANLYPTLTSTAVLDTTRPLKLESTDLSALLAHLGALGPLKAHGMRTEELSLALRGLERHGYAELDARRTACPIRWVVLRCAARPDPGCLVVEIGSSDLPAAAAQYGLDPKRPPAESGIRSDPYGRGSRIDAWRGLAARAAVELRRVQPMGGDAYWEFEYRAPLLDRGKKDS